MRVPSGRAVLAADVVGGGEHTDVLLVHAGVVDSRSWAPLVTVLSGTRRCITFDQRGYGDTDYEVEDGWSPVADALAVLDAVGSRRAVVVGASMGGALAVELALLHPDRVAGLVLIGPAVRGAPFPELEPGPVADVVAAAEAAEEAGSVEEQNRLEAWVWLDGPGEPEGRVGGETRELFLAMNARALAAEDPGRRDVLADAWSRLGEVAAPTLVLCGRLDVPDIRAVSEGVARAVPGATFHWLEGVAHLPHLEGDPTTLRLVREHADTC